MVEYKKNIILISSVTISTINNPVKKKENLDYREKKNKFNLRATNPQIFIINLTLFYTENYLI